MSEITTTGPSFVPVSSPLSAPAPLPATVPIGSWRRLSGAGLLALGLATGLAGCGRDPSPAPAPPRAVKLERAAASQGNGPLFVATVRQQQRADLSFESGGRIETMTVDVGDRVHQGQVLASLDTAALRMKLRQAEAQWQQATAQWRERDTQWRQQRALFDDGSASQATLTSAEAARDAALAQRQAAEAELDLARRALRQADIRAPFSGNVVARLAQPKGDTAAGQPVLQVEGEGQPQVTALLPAEVAQRLIPGAKLRARRPDMEAPLQLAVRGVSSRREAGGQVVVILDVQGTAPDLRSGDSLLLAVGDDAQTPAVISLPLSAVAARLPGSTAEVFVYQPEAGRISRRIVTLGPITGDRVAIRQGLAAGEPVVAAGVAFLMDGQAVQPVEALSRLFQGGAR